MFKKISQLFIFTFLLIFFASSCGGKFILVKNTYDLNNSIKVTENKKLNDFTKSAFFYLLGWWVYPFASIGDFFVLNVIEFWTDKNPLDSEKSNSSKTFEKDGNKLSFHYSEDGEILTLKFQNELEKAEFIFKKNEIGKVFTNKNNELQEIQLTEKNIGDKKLIQLSENKKITSTRVLEIEEFNKFIKRATAKL